MTRSSFLALSAIAALVAACAPEASELGAADPAASAAKAAKVDVCHVDEDTGEWSAINISEKAVDKHLDNHGDWLVGDEVCGDGVDNDCDGEIDEDCCPLWDDFGGLPEAGEFDGYEYGYTFASDADPDVLYSYTDVYFYGWATDGSWLRFSVDFWDMGSWYEPIYGDGYQETTWTYTDADGITTGDAFVGEITADEYAACTEEAFAWSDSSDAFYSWDNRDGL